MPSRVQQGEPEIVREGWLRKSPWAQWKMKLPGVRWSKKWFVLRSGTLPGDCRLEYYDNETKKKPKKDNVIDLGHCIQVDSYLIHEAGKNKVYKWIFDVKLDKRQYYLVAASEQEMNAWVHDLCHVCNLEREEPQDTSDEPVIPPEDLLQNMLNHNLDSTSGITNEYLMEQGARAAQNYSRSHNDLDRIEDSTPENESRFFPFEFPIRDSSISSVDHNSVAATSSGSSIAARAAAANANGNSLPRRGIRNGPHPSGNYQRPVPHAGEAAANGGPYLVSNSRLNSTSSNGSIAAGNDYGVRSYREDIPVNLHTEPTQGRGYVKLWSDCVSAKPRPGKKVESPSRGTAVSQVPLYDPPPQIATNFVTPGPINGNGNHARGASTDSTTSSLQLSVNSDELNSTSEGDSTNHHRHHHNSQSAAANLGSRSASFGTHGASGTSPPGRPPKQSQVSLNAVVPPPSLSQSAGCEGEALYTNDMTGALNNGGIAGSYDAPPQNPMNIFTGTLPKSKSMENTALNSGTGSLPRPPRISSRMPGPGYTPMQGKVAFYEPMNPFAYLDDLPFDEPISEETYQNTEAVARNSEGETSPPPSGELRKQSAPPGKQKDKLDWRKVSAPPTVDRSLKPERRTRESEGSTTSGGGPSPPPVLPDRLLKSSSGGHIVNGRQSQISKQRVGENGFSPVTPGKVYRNQGPPGVGEGKPPPVPDKPRITIERKESFVKKYAGGNCPQPAKVPKNLPKTSVKPKYTTNNNNVGAQAASPNPKSPLGLGTPVVRSPVKGFGANGKHHQVLSQHRMASKSESELLGSAPNSLKPPQVQGLEYVDVEMPTVSARTPSPAHYLLDSDGGRDSPGGSPQQRKMHYALIDETATKAVKKMNKEQQKFRSLERDKNKHSRIFHVRQH